MHDANAKRTCGVDKNLSEMTLSEIKDYTEKTVDITAAILKEYGFENEARELA